MKPNHKPTHRKIISFRILPSCSKSEFEQGYIHYLYKCYSKLTTEEQQYLRKLAYDIDTTGALFVWLTRDISKYEVASDYYYSDRTLDRYKLALYDKFSTTEFKKYK